MSSTCDADGNGLAELQDGSEIEIPKNVAPDELENFEIGYKTSINQSISLSASIYHISWEGIPVSIGLLCTGSALLNAGESQSRGFEIESQFVLSEQFSLDISASYNESELTEDATGLGAGAVDGAPLPGSADLNITAGLEYAFVLEGFDAFVRFDYSYIGEYYGNFTETGQNSGDYSLLGLKVGADFGQLSSDLYINNLTNADDFTWNETFFGQFGFSRGYQLRPRTIGLNLRYQF